VEGGDGGGDGDIDECGRAGRAAVTERIVLADSSVLASAAYDRAVATLQIEFRNGRAYRYFLVPRHVVDGLVAAESAGAFFNEHIRGTFSEERVR
jgi:hypothetical protein